MCGLFFQAFHKAAERDAALELIAAREVSEARDIGENLMAGGAKGESGVGPCCFQQTVQSIRHRAPVPPPM